MGFFSYGHPGHFEGLTWHDNQEIVFRKKNNNNN
jgi:hypothetical protein